MTAALIVDDVDQHSETPGAVEYRALTDGGAVEGIAFVCPCGCGRQGYLPVDTETAAPRWNFNGDRVRPTVTPSVQFRGGCCWHGYLTDGEWRAC